MQSTGGGASPRGLDARLLRFRSRPGTEEPAKLAEDLLAAGRGAESVEVVESGLQAAPNDARLLLAHGRALLHEGDFDRAQAALVSAARIDARNKDAFRYLGEVLLKRGDPARAFKVLERASLLDPDDRAIKLLVERSGRLARLAEGDPAAAAAAARQSMAPAPPPADDDESDQATVVRAEPVAPTVQAKRPSAGAPMQASVERDPSGRHLVDTGDIILDDDEDSPTSVGFTAPAEVIPSPFARAEPRLERHDDRTGDDHQIARSRVSRLRNPESRARAPIRAFTYQRRPRGAAVRVQSSATSRDAHPCG